MDTPEKAPLFPAFQRIPKWFALLLFRKYFSVLSARFKYETKISHVKIFLSA